MNRWAGKIAVVTGASSGNGLATSQALVQEGMIVVGLARRKAKMEASMKDEKKAGKFHALECDITKENQVIQSFEWIKKNLGSVHVLVNNAGIMKARVKIADMKTEDMIGIFNTNVFGLLHCSRQAIQIMKDGGIEGHIINISSILGQPNLVSQSIHTNVYAASKRAIVGVSDALRMELVGEKIRVTTISPGGVNTPLIGFGARAATALGVIPMLESEDIANAIVYIIATPLRVQITDLIIRPFGETTL